jgi:60 kDa SS-A/Ro ribonucleoprotein
MRIVPYLNKVSRTPQNQPIAAEQDRMILNSAGGYAFAADDWTRLRRFLIIGTDKGTYYADEQKLTEDAIQLVRACIAHDSAQTLNIVLDVRARNLALRLSPLLFTYAAITILADELTIARAYAALGDICQTASQLFEFLEARKGLRGHNLGAGARRAVARWYRGRRVENVAYQMVKYRQRAGFTHGDVLRLARPKTDDAALSRLYRWAIGKATDVDRAEGLPAVIQRYERVQGEIAEADLIEIARGGLLPFEAFPTPALRNVGLWRALLDADALPMTALIRNLGRMTNLGLFPQMEDNAYTRKVVALLTEGDALQKSRVHPLALLQAWAVYKHGMALRGGRGEGMKWSPNAGITAALLKAAERAFVNVTPIGQPLLVALDCSGSMSANISGTPLRAFDAGAFVAWMYLRTEPQVRVIAFNDKFIDPQPQLDAGASYEDVKRALWQNGSTDVAQPMLYLEKVKLAVNAVVQLTDSESWAGKQHVIEAFRRIKQKRPDLKLANVQMTFQRSTLYPPEEAAQMEIAGFNPSVFEAARLHFGGEF